MTEINLYRVTISAPVSNETFFIVAESFNAAASKAMEMDQGESELENGGVSSIHIVATAGGPDANWTMTDAASESLGFS